MIPLFFPKTLFAVLYDRIEPIEDVQSTIGSKFQVHGAKIGVFGLEQRFHFTAHICTTIWDHLVLPDSLKSDKCIEQNIPLYVFRKIVAGNNLYAAGFGRKSRGQKPSLAGVFDRVVDMGAQRCSKMTS